MRNDGKEAAPAAAPAVVSKALLRAAERLEMSRQALAAMLGISEASLTRLSQGRRVLDPESKEGELALLFLRAYRSLDTLFGGNRSNSVQWFKAPNTHLEGIPETLVQRIGGLVDVAGYLDAMRGKV